MGKDYLELLNDLARAETNKSFERVKMVEQDNEWILNQFMNKLRAEFEDMDFETLSEKLAYLNARFNYQLNHEVLVNKHRNPQVIPSLSDNLSVNELVLSKLYHHLNQNAQSADGILIISPFISQPTINKLRSLLENDQKIALKIISTTYDGNSTHLELVGLQKLYHDYASRVQIRVENLTSPSQDRLHIKNYFFKRNDQFSTAFIGSSNLTKTGVVTGKEYNLKISEFREPKLIKELEDNFAKLWNDPKFVDFSDRKTIDELILKRERFLFQQEFLASQLKLSRQPSEEALLTEIVQPFDYQQEILNVLNERMAMGKNKHLIVMATGTGKTALAAFFYKQLFNQMKTKPSLLYISHQQEILTQAQRMFQNVLKDHRFGTDFFDGSTIGPDDHQIFATIQTLSNHLDEVANQRFDLVIYDEAHHIQAATYKKVYETLKPFSHQIVGLTATPKRTEGFDVKDYFFDGEYAYCLDLANALDRSLLSNFDYYFIKDDIVDLKNVDISTQTKILSQRLSTIKRNEFVYDNLLKYVGAQRHDVSVLLFCVDKNHANSVATYLAGQKEKVAVLFGDTNKESRQTIIQHFKNKEINYLCVVNIFNEGVDVPNIDHLFLLRPTSSLIVYLQQLGRGLRKLPDKRLEIFDFINNIDSEVNKNYNPFIFLEPLMNSDLTNKQVKELGVNFESITSYVAGDSLFHFEKASKQYFKNKVGQMTERSYNHRINQLLASYWEANIDDYETYENFILNNFDNIYQFYGMHKNSFYFKQNQLLKDKDLGNLAKIFAKFSVFNNASLIETLLAMITTFQPSVYRTVNDLLIVSCFVGLNEYHSFLEKNHTNELLVAFKNKKYKYLLKELSYLLRFKLRNEDLVETLINDETTSYLESTFTKPQAMVITKVIYKESGTLTNWKGGVVLAGFIKTTGIYANNVLCSVSVATGNTKYGYINDYNKVSRELRWDSQNNWVKKNGGISKSLHQFENLAQNKIWFIYSDQGLINKFQVKNGASLSVFRLIGETEAILDKKIKDEEKGVLTYTLKIKNKN